MGEFINRCPICSKIVSIKKDWKVQEIENVNGICWSDIGYSMGGWGRRQNFIHAFSGEVCNSCFGALKTKIDELKKVIEERRNSCEEGICIYKTSNDRSGGDHVPDMQEGEPQQKRYRKPLLRLLSSFSRR